MNTTVFQYNVPADNCLSEVPDLMLEIKASLLPEGGVHIKILTQLTGYDLSTVIDWKRILSDCKDLASDHFRAHNNAVIFGNNPVEILNSVHGNLVEHFTRNTH